MDHAPLDVRRRPFVFFHQGAWQHDVGVAGRLRHEEVDHCEELEAPQRFADELAVGKRDRRIETEEQQALDVAVVDRFEERYGRQASVRDGRLFDAPHAGDVFAMRRISQGPCAPGS